MHLHVVKPASSFAAHFEKHTSRDEQASLNPAEAGLRLSCDGIHVLFLKPPPLEKRFHMSGPKLPVPLAAPPNLWRDGQSVICQNHKHAWWRTVV